MARPAADVLRSVMRSRQYGQDWGQTIKAVVDSPYMTQAHPPRWLLTAGGGLVVAALAGGAFVATFDTLRALAVRGGASRHYAYLYPWMLDGLVVVLILSILMSRRFRWWSRAVRWLLLLALIAGAGAAGVERTVRGYDRLPHAWVSGGVAVAPWVILLLAFWLWVSMIKQARRARPEEPPPALEPAGTGIIPGLADEPRPLTPPPALPELAPVREEEPEPVARTLLPTDVPLVGTPNDTQPDGVKLPDTRPDGIPVFESAEDEDKDEPGRAEDASGENAEPPSGKVRSSPTPPRD
jgi:hypothetical protein